MQTKTTLTDQQGASDDSSTANSSVGNFIEILMEIAQNSWNYVTNAKKKKRHDQELPVCVWGLSLPQRDFENDLTETREVEIDKSGFILMNILQLVPSISRISREILDKIKLKL